MKKEEHAFFSLTAAQQAAYGVQPYVTKKHEVQTAACVIGERSWNFKQLRKAMLQVIENNDALRLTFEKDRKGLRQYVSEQAHLPHLYSVTFSTKDEQDGFFARASAAALKPLKDETMEVFFFKSFNGRRGVFVKAFAPVLDTAGMAAFLREVLRAYAAQEREDAPADEAAPTQAFLPPEEITDDAAEENRAFFKAYFGEDGGPVYAGVHGPELLNKARKKRPDTRVPAVYDTAHDAARSVVKTTDAPLRAALAEFARARRLPPLAVLDLCSRIAAEQLNDAGWDTMAIEASPESDAPGCFSRYLPVRARLTGDMMFEQAAAAIAQTAETVRSHKTQTFTAVVQAERESLSLKDNAAGAFALLTYTALPDFENAALEWQFFSAETVAFPVRIDFFDDPAAKKLRVTYTYRKKLTDAEKIDAFHEILLRALQTGLENPAAALGTMIERSAPQQETAGSEEPTNEEGEKNTDVH